MQKKIFKFARSTKGAITFYVYLRKGKVYFTESVVKRAFNIDYKTFNVTVQHCIQLDKFGIVRSVKDDRIFSSRQIRIMRHELSEFFGIAKNFSKDYQRAIRAATKKFTTKPQTVHSSKFTKVEATEIASLSQQFEEFRELLILDDLPRAIFLLLGDPSSPTHQSLLSSLDRLLHHRFAELKQSILAELREELLQELKANLDVANAARQL